MSDLLEFLAANPTLGEVQEPALSLLLEGASLRTIAPGAILSSEGRLSDEVFVLRQGIARTWWKIPPHHRMLRALVCGPALLCCNGAAAHFTTSALTELLVVTLDRRRFDAWVERQPVVLLRFLGCADRTESTLRERLRQQRRDLSERVAELLHSYLLAYRKIGERDRTEIPLTNSAIGADLGVVERSISSALGALRQRELIRTTRGGVVVLDLPGLVSCAGDQASFVLGGQAA